MGESPSEAAEREVKEESGYKVRAVRLLALWDRDKHPHPPLPFHVYKLFFRCELLGGDPLVAGTETDGVGFLRKDVLPGLSLGRVTPRQIERLVELATDGERPPSTSLVRQRFLSTLSTRVRGRRMLRTSA